MVKVDATSRKSPLITRTQRMQEETNNSLTQLIRDQFTIQTWLSFGAILQGGLFLLFGRLALLPAFLYLLYTGLDAYTIATGWRANPYLADTIPHNFAAAIPDAEGNYGPTPAASSVVVLLIGTRWNHPAGMFAPGVRQIADHFTGMVRTLQQKEEYGLLGTSAWLSAGDSNVPYADGASAPPPRTSHNELMNVMYFASVEQLHAFAQGPEHRAAWDWWNRTVHQHRHISIWHETYHAPPGHWEAIAANSHPRGVMATRHKVWDSGKGEAVFASPVVDARKGVLKSAKGRMARGEFGGEGEGKKEGYGYGGDV